MDQTCRHPRGLVHITRGSSNIGHLLVTRLCTSPRVIAYLVAKFRSDLTLVRNVMELVK